MRTGHLAAWARRAAAAAALSVGVTGALAGCGGDEVPAEAVPALAERLDAVDAAVAEEDYAAARAALRRLVRETERAREAGDLDDDQADAVLAAAARLEQALPDGAPTPDPSPTTDPPSAPSPEGPGEQPPEDEDEEEREEEREEREEKKEEKGEKGEKGEKSGRAGNGHGKGGKKP